MIKFIKMHGLSNDFVIIRNQPNLKKLNLKKLAQKICNRQIGIGADGLVVLSPSTNYDIAMKIINADGSIAEQCGNAIRCVALYIAKLKNKNHLKILTDAGIREAWVDNKNVKVNMGKPNLAPENIHNNGSKKLTVTYGDKQKIVNFNPVSIGNPHIVIEVKDDLDTFDVGFWGPMIEKHHFFPEGVNIEFVKFNSKESATMRVWERGAGETNACGTGACAVLVTGNLLGKLNKNATISLAAGKLDISWDKEIFMRGPAEYVFSGTLV